jgi:hypothetical protein
VALSLSSTVHQLAEPKKGLLCPLLTQSTCVLAVLKPPDRTASDSDLVSWSRGQLKMAAKRVRHSFQLSNAALGFGALCSSEPPRYSAVDCWRQNSCPSTLPVLCIDQ